MTETITTRPIEGEIPRYTNRSQTAQEGVTEFLAAVDALLAIPGIEAIKWEQYTPYFNDGDACEFGIMGEVRVRFEGDDEEAGDYEDGFHETWGLTFKNDAGDYPYANIEGYELTDETREALKAADFNFNRFEDVLQTNFGDPAEVTATKEGFKVEFYDHD